MPKTPRSIVCPADKLLQHLALCVVFNLLSVVGLPNVDASHRGRTRCALVKFNANSIPPTCWSSPFSRVKCSGSTLTLGWLPAGVLSCYLDPGFVESKCEKLQVSKKHAMTHMVVQVASFIRDYWFVWPSIVPICHWIISHCSHTVPSYQLLI